jgi:hypothetical protein
MSGGSPVTAPLTAPATVSDKVTVSGSGATPTGTVTFTFFTNGTCSGTGSAAGSPTLSGGTATSNTESGLAAGSYSFQATYNGDTTYLPSTGDCEPFTVVQLASHTVTTVMSGGSAVTGPLNAPATVTDSATVTGSGPTPTGTVTFTFFTNGTCTPTGTSAGTFTLSSTGTATSNTESGLAAGSYSFQATYNGDTTYLPSTGACEPFTVQAPGVVQLTPGFWKNHPNATGPLLPLPLGNYTVTTFAQAQAVLSSISCGTTGIGCLAGQLLATELNVANGGSTCIAPVIAQANALLVTIGYNGPGTGSVTSAQAAQAKSLASQLAAYSSDKVGC